MVALAYDNMGGISGVTKNPKLPGSVRSRDGNGTQRMSFRCDRDRPFTGKIHVQATIDSPTRADPNVTWFDIAEMIIDNEGGSWSYEFEGEFASVRVVCREGNYWSAAHGAPGRLLSANGIFTINGISVSVTSGSDAEAVAEAINTTAGIISNGTIRADVVQTSALRIYKTDGAPLILQNATNTPLNDLGITPGTFKAGVIASISLLR